MKREFLQNFKVGDQPLPKEIIDAILDEHSRSIGAIKADNDSLRSQLQTAKDGLKAFEGVDVKDLQGQIAQLQRDLADKDAAHQTELATLAFNQDMADGIKAANGRNVDAIIAVLGTERVEALRKSTNRKADIAAAMQELQQDSGYLFGDAETPPPYSGKTGTDPYQRGQGSDATMRAAMGLPTKNN